MIPVLWLCGPPGVGKTAVAWELYSQLVGTGVNAAYVDIDQLGICYPEPPVDPGRYKMKGRNLNAVLRGFQTAGVQCAVVSGVVDTAHGVSHDEISEAILTVCRLRAQPLQLRQRLAARRESVDEVESALRESEALDASTFADVCIDTSEMSVDEVVQKVRGHIGVWPGEVVSSISATPIASATDTPNGSILWLFGPTGVGKSTVGFNLYMKLLATGRMAAYVDIDQVGFCSTAPLDHGLRAYNLAALWRTYRLAGAEALIVVGPIHSESDMNVYAGTLPAATFTWCRLHAERSQLTSRIMSRKEGGSWPQPGDPLKGQSSTYLLQVAEQAVADGEALETSAIGLRVQTDDLTIEQTADAIFSRTGWLAG